MRGLRLVVSAMCVLALVGVASACPPVEVAATAVVQGYPTVSVAVAAVPLVSAVPVVSSVVVAPTAVTVSPVALSNVGVCAVGGVQVQASGLNFGGVGLGVMPVVRPRLRLFRPAVRSTARVVVR